jgi:hypothetical protein
MRCLDRRIVDRRRARIGTSLREFPTRIWLGSAAAHRNQPANSFTGKTIVAGNKEAMPIGRRGNKGRIKEQRRGALEVRFRPSGGDFLSRKRVCHCEQRISPRSNLDRTSLCRPEIASSRVEPAGRNDKTAPWFNSVGKRSNQLCPIF